MADILFVCVRRDIERADALARMFQSAGFSVGDMPSADAALRSSGAGIVLWSSAAMQSLPFHDAARRLVKAGRAVLADLGGAALPPSLSSPPAFDLSNWNGDPDDALIDPLFSAVDRMVADVRAQIERWQAICESRDPSVFADYVALYGLNGVYAEEAELRLKLLSAGQSRMQQRVAASAGAVAYAAPAMPDLRREPPPRPAPAAPPPHAYPGASPSPPGADGERARPRPDRSGPRARKRRRPGRLRRAVMLAPLVIGAVLAAMVYVGGVEDSKDPAYRVRIPLPPVEAADAGRSNPPALPESATTLSLASHASGLPANDPAERRDDEAAAPSPQERGNAGGPSIAARAVKAAPPNAAPFTPASRLLDVPRRAGRPLTVTPVSIPALAYDFAPATLAPWPGGARRARDQSGAVGAAPLDNVVISDVAPARRDQSQGPQP